MKPEDFIKLAEDHIYKEVAKNTNQLLGQDKTAALSTGLFLKLPIVVSVEQSRESIPKMYKELKTFLNYFSAYTKLEDTTKVYFTFLYHTEQDLQTIANNLERHNIFFAFVYLHEVQHILRKHITKSYSTMMTRIAGDTISPHHLINIAEDHAINYSLKDLFMVSKLKSYWPDIEECGMYDAKYHASQMSDIDILKDLIKQNKPLTKKQLSDMLSEITMDGKSSIQPTDGPGQDSEQESNGKGNKPSESKVDKCSTVSDDIDNALADLAESLQDIIQSNTKGTKAGELFKQLFSSVKVDTGWFKKIKASFKRQVYYKTHDYTTSWANLNNTFRKIYKSPKKNFIDDKIAIILSVDHSGSMSTKDLQRLLYLIESESKRIASLTVLIHDTRVIQSFTIEDQYDISNSPEFTKALATRYTSGGTSHACVFEYIQNLKLQDTSKVMYMSFSDNQSDIEQTFNKYPVMRKLTNYWVCTDRKPMNVLGTNITMV